jgi:predicted DNA-binding protein (UPF0251 family)
MARIRNEKKYVIIRRNELIKAIDQEGYDQADIALIFNVSETTISNIITDRLKKVPETK